MPTERSTATRRSVQTPVPVSKLLGATKPLRAQSDIAARMVAGIDKYLQRELAASRSRRSMHWQRDLSPHRNYLRSVKPKRERLARIIGVAEEREPVELYHVSTARHPGLVCASDSFHALAVRWSVLPGVDAEGLLLRPNRTVIADMIALPDCDWTPEMLVGTAEGVPPEAQFARRLAENGCRVLVPMLIDRRDTYSGLPGVRMTNQSHREFLYRAAYEMGRHILGYEVQKVLAAVDWFRQDAHGPRPLGVIGYGEGGLLALYAAALDTRLDAAVVSGCFQPREEVWREPIYRNVWALLHEFGDAEIASLIAPRPLIIEASSHPEVAGPPQTPNRAGAAPGALTTPPLEAVTREVRRARRLVKGLNPPAEIQLVQPPGDLPGSEQALAALLRALGCAAKLEPLGRLPDPFPLPLDADARLKRQFDQILEHTQHLMREAELTRARFWAKTEKALASARSRVPAARDNHPGVEQLRNSLPPAWQRACRWHRRYFWEEVIGKLPPPNVPANPRVRQVYETPAFTGYEVVLDVYPDVFAYGILLLPKDLAEGEQRPVVVCQHGLEGRPQDVADPGVDNDAYHQYACKLAERGFVTYAPQNPYLGGDAFRVLQRKANPLKLSLFSFIVRQHERTLEWLASLPFVDPKRIAFYGLSYGGKTAMRVPALLDGYCLSICSGDYNEWIWKNVSTRHRYSYLFTGEYEMPEFDLGNTFNYAEMSWLICPRPFMVERGHSDGVAPDEWVAYEYAKTRRRYDELGLGDRTEIEFFNGPHTINGVGTFAFLERMLRPRGTGR